MEITDGLIKENNNLECNLKEEWKLNGRYYGRKRNYSRGHSGKHEEMRMEEAEDGRRLTRSRMRIGSGERAGTRTTEEIG